MEPPTSVNSINVVAVSHTRHSNADALCSTYQTRATPVTFDELQGDFYS